MRPAAAVLPILALLAAVAACAGASDDDAAPGSEDLGWGGSPDLGVSGDVQELRHDFGAWDLEVGEEVIDLCFSWTLDNEEEVLVNAVELRNKGFWHHSNWVFVPDDHYAGPDGAWPCTDRGFHEVDGALAGGVLYAQSTQAKYELQQFPPGAVVRMPPHARVIASAHLLNYSTAPVHTEMRMRVFGIAPADVKVQLNPFRLEYDDLQIPPMSKARVMGECDIDGQFQSNLGHPMDAKLYYLLPHTHALGVNVTVQIMGGPRDGEVLLSTVTNNFEANGKAFDPPVDMTGAKGFRYWCEYDNPRDESVGWGFGDQEMCEILGYADSGLLWDAQTAKFDGSGHEVVPGSEEAIRLASSMPEEGPLFTGPCEVLAVSR